jgi:hypothetical protein
MSWRIDVRPESTGIDFPAGGRFNLRFIMFDF